MSTEESKHLIENLKRAYKAAIVDPLVQKLAAATRKRFRAQARAVGRAIRGKLSESDATKGRAAATAALGAFSYPAWLKAHQKATSAAYGGGSGVAAGQLAAEIPDDLVGFSGSAEEAAAAIDETTVRRLRFGGREGRGRRVSLGGRGSGRHDRSA